VAVAARRSGSWVCAPITPHAIRYWGSYCFLESVWPYWLLGVGRHPGRPLRAAPLGGTPTQGPANSKQQTANGSQGLPGARLKTAPGQHRRCTGTGFSSRYRRAGGWLLGRPIRGYPPPPPIYLPCPPEVPPPTPHHLVAPAMQQQKVVRYRQDFIRIPSAGSSQKRAGSRGCTGEVYPNPDPPSAGARGGSLAGQAKGG
jgi:hypothetical protein